MNDRPLLAKLMDSTAVELRSRFERSGAASDHAGSKGTVREEFLAAFLREQLPRKIEVYGSSEIITASGSISTQCDVVLADPTTPPLFAANAHRVIPNECVYAVIEVKSSLDKAELHESCDKLAKIRALPKTAYYPMTAGTAYRLDAYGRSWSYWPTTTAIFAYGGSGIDTLARNLMDWCGPRPLVDWPDCVWVLGQGFLGWTLPGQRRLDFHPEPGSSILALQPLAGQDVLLPMTLALNATMAGAVMPRFKLLDYAGESTLGAVVSCYRWEDDAGTEEQKTAG